MTSNDDSRFCQLLAGKQSFWYWSLAPSCCGWGAISFKNLPVEAYPDVANNYVQVITQWPGRAGEEVEQQVTIPIEVQMAGIPQLSNIRSISEFGLSVVTMNFDDASQNDWNRQKVFERLSQVTLPNNLQPSIGPDYSPVGQLYWYTLTSTNPQFDLMELKSLQDWVITKELKSVPDVVDVSSFGGVTREYQVPVDPNKLISYGLSIGQVEQALANNNVNAGGSFIQAGEQQVNVRELGLFRKYQRYFTDRPEESKRHARCWCATSALVTQGPRSAWGRSESQPPPGRCRIGRSRHGGRNCASPQGGKWRCSC